MEAGCSLNGGNAGLLWYRQPRQKRTAHFQLNKAAQAAEPAHLCPFS